MSFKTAEVPKIEVAREQFALPGGATLIVHRREASPVTAVRIHLRGGIQNDPAGKEGLAFYTGAFADQGTAERSDEDIARLLEPEGGAISGDALGLAGAVVGDGWSTLVDVLGEVVRGASYPDALLERHFDRMRTRLAVEAEDPRSQGGVLFKGLIYGDGHFLGRSAHGTLDSLNSITTEDLRGHRLAHWCASRLVVVVVGNVDAQEVARRVEKAFDGLPAGTPHGFVEGSFPERGERQAKFVRERNQVHVHLGHLGIVRANPDYAALAVMDHVLGTGPGFTNRITKVLRDEMGLAYSVHADIHGSAGLHPGVFRAYIGTSPDKVDTAIEGFKREIRRIQDEPVPEEELSVAQSYLVGSFATGFERAARRANYLVAAHIHGFPEDHLQTLPAEFAAVTQEDIQRVAQTYLVPDQCCVVQAGGCLP